MFWLSLCKSATQLNSLQSAKHRPKESLTHNSQHDSKRRHMHNHHGSWLKAMCHVACSKHLVTGVVMRETLFLPQARCSLHSWAMLAVSTAARHPGPGRPWPKTTGRQTPKTWKLI